MNSPSTLFSWLACPVVFICTCHERQRDIMTATAMFISEKEPLLTVSVAKGHLTDRLIQASGELILAIGAASQKKLALQLGSCRGDETDKYGRFSVATLPSNRGEGLVPEDSAAWMKCQVEDIRSILGYRVIAGRVLEQQDLQQAPLVWHKDGFFRLAPV
jgi:flavin reductase (DIM6/NTAB) family NADH-FMN oxidoreductase RutF